MERRRTTVGAWMAVLVAGAMVFGVEGRRLDKALELQRKETTPVNFSRLVVMRLIYGVASMLGLEDRLGGVLNGVFVPPGVDDDYDLGFDDDDDDTAAAFELGDIFDL